MTKTSGFFEGTEMPAAGWWEALWPNPATVLAAVGMSSGMSVIDLCCGDGWFTLQIAKLAKHVVARSTSIASCLTWPAFVLWRTV